MGAFVGSGFRRITYLLWLSHKKFLHYLTSVGCVVPIQLRSRADDPPWSFLIYFVKILVV